MEKLKQKGKKLEKKISRDENATYEGERMTAEKTERLSLKEKAKVVFVEYYLLLSVRVRVRVMLRAPKKETIPPAPAPQALPHPKKGIWRGSETHCNIL